MLVPKGKGGTTVNEQCELCGKEMTTDEAVWITKHYHVCEDCFDNLCPEELQQLIEDYG